MNIADIVGATWMVDHQVILLPGERGAWDDWGVYTPHILMERNGYRMYYTGRNAKKEWAIGTATSTDLMHWVKHPEPILCSGESWDKQIDFAWPIKDNETYYVYFEAKKSLHVPKREAPIEIRSDVMTLFHMDTRSTGLALSKDGVHFQKQPHPVLRPGRKGTWDHRGICASRVYRHGDGYWMFYAGSDGNVACSGLAFSKDLLHWRRYRRNPIIDVGVPGAWDCRTALFGSVVELADGYVGAYEGEDGRKLQIGLAFSKDLKHWTRFEGNPIIQTHQNYVEHSTFVCAPCLVVHGNDLYLLYTHNTPFDGKLCKIEIAGCRR